MYDFFKFVIRGQDGHEQFVEISKEAIRDKSLLQAMFAKAALNIIKHTKDEHRITISRKMFYEAVEKAEKDKCWAKFRHARPDELAKELGFED